MSERPETKNGVKEIRLQTLGRFAVWLGIEKLPDSAWGREKARKLFQYLLTYRQRHTPKERIVAELWPELDPDRADRDFKVALNALQSTLQPGRPARAPSAYITRQEASYGLNPDAPFRVDAVEFEAGITAGSAAEREGKDQAIDLYRNALDLYRGEYLPGAIYEDWSSVERERLATLYLSGANRLARLLLEQGSELEAINWSQRVIAADPCWEDAYRLLMWAYMAGGNRPLAVRAYEQCRRNLAEDLGIEPMAETTRLYQQIKAGERI